MNETIGARGGKNDRRRVIKIKNKKLKELKEIEKEIRKKQISNIIKLIPIAIIGSSEKLLENNKEEKEQIKEQKEVVIINIKKEKISKKEKEEEKVISKEETPIKEEFIVNKPKKGNNEQEEIKEIITNNEDVVPTINIIRNEISNEEKDNTEDLKKVKAQKIIDTYSKELKSIRTDLRHLIFDYNMMVDESDDLYTSKEADKLLDSLNYLIKKVDELKRKIKVDNLDKYDENYIYTLIEDYLKEFRDKKAIKEIKDNNLFIDISEKIDELSSKKDKLKKKVENRKEKLKIKEDNFKDLKEKYYNLDRFNDYMYAVEKEQESLLRSIKDKVAKAKTEKERVQTEIEYLDGLSKRLIALMALQMIIPKAYGAKRAVTAAVLYAYFMERMLNAKVKTKKYKEIRVIDYTKDIENRIDELDSITSSLNKTSKEIDKIIKSFKKDYKEYIDIFPEYKSFISNLNKVKDDLEEKEEEIKQIKKEQEKQLDINKVQIKQRGIYDM